jgi:pimeloyl-ACP methyl ester carboxylesterase
MLYFQLQGPVTLARRAARSLPNAQLITYPDEGHISTFNSHVEEIAAVLLGR